MIPGKVRRTATLSVLGLIKIAIAVLLRDGVGVVTDASCASVSGTWISAYDGVSFNVSSKLDIVRFAAEGQLIR